MTRGSTVYAHPPVLEAKYQGGSTRRSIGIPKAVLVPAELRLPNWRRSGVTLVPSRSMLTQPLNIRVQEPQLEDADDESVVTEFSDAMSTSALAASDRSISARRNNPLPRTSREKCSAIGKTLGLIP